MDYFALSAERIRQRLDVLRALVTDGTVHAEEIGGLCENAVRDFLRESLPQRFGVASGFVDFGQIPGLGPQSEPLDVLIYDALHYAPLYRDGTCVVVRPEALVSVLEVKAVLTAGPTGQFARAQQQLSFLEALPPRPNRPRGHIFAVEGLTCEAAQNQLADQEVPFLRTICVLSRNWCVVNLRGERKVYLDRAFYFFYYHLLLQIHQTVGARFVSPPDLNVGGEP